MNDQSIRWQQRFGPPSLSVLRIVLSFTFSLHGFQLVLGFFGGAGNHGHPAPLYSLSWIAGVLEVAGGVLLFAGLATRLTAFILSGEMAVAYFLVHFPRGFLPIQNGGELSSVYAFCFLFIAIWGPGPISVEAHLGSKRHPTSAVKSPDLDPVLPS